MSKGEVNKKESKNPLIEKVFPESNTSVFIHGTTKRNLAYVVIALQRFLGKQRVVFNNPYFNQEKKVWITQVYLNIPKIITSRRSYVAITEAEDKQEPPDMEVDE